MIHDVALTMLRLMFSNKFYPKLEMILLQEAIYHKRNLHLIAETGTDGSFVRRKTYACSFERWNSVGQKLNILLFLIAFALAG
ncbi:MAG: hypothetical protein K2Q13_05005 [Nitrosomonas sp.]|uniref:hypothetical protein n=1 Tax=Nitrosomonas sp. TaxID=42353 RepID=UPI0025E8BABE|nr:hypothetical protein [Nitrosomonas sp.]MBY0474410.1 hypothetical protein [Nitrosomonas sp.]